jgi:hypothetical protein
MFSEGSLSSVETQLEKTVAGSEREAAEETICHAHAEACAAGEQAG